MGELTQFKRPDGGLTNCYLARAGDGRPGVVVIQEWWGLNDHIKAIADRFAEAGYNALAPDLYAGRLAKDADEAGHLMNNLDFADATHQDIRGAVYFLHLLGSKSATGAVSRVGVVDVGSNSVRMVVFDGAARSPAYFYNEKVMCGLGKSLAETGRLNPEGRVRGFHTPARNRSTLPGPGRAFSSRAVRSTCSSVSAEHGPAMSNGAPLAVRRRVK